MTRHELRERIFKTVFQLPFYEAFEGELPEVVDEQEISEDDQNYISNKVAEINNHLPEIDKIITEHSDGWKHARIGKVELAIIRLAIYEIKVDEDVPDKVAVNEAIELAKKYGDEKAARFINGVLSGLL